MKALFISDAHLGAKIIADHKAHERRLVDFLDSVASDADRLYMLGDMIDFWWEYRNVVPRGFTRFFGALSRLADSGVELTWLKGNHDIWMRDYLRDEIGVRIIDGALTEEICGHSVFMEHGDGVGRQPASYRAIRALFRNHVAQKAFGAIHPRIAVPLASGLSKTSRKNGSTDTSRALQNLREFVKNYSSSHPQISSFIFGHLHNPVDEMVGEARMVVLGDWMENPSYAVLSDDAPLTLKSF